MRARLLSVSLAAALAVMLVVAAAASAGSAPPIKSFKLPGNKVRCVIAGGARPTAGVLCIGKLNPGVKGFPRRNCHGEGDTGGGLSMGLIGKPSGICLSEDPFVPPIRLLAYGKTISVGNISCAAVSKTIGVRCENANSHGFQISASGWRRF